MARATVRPPAAGLRPEYRSKVNSDGESVESNGSVNEHGRDESPRIAAATSGQTSTEPSTVDESMGASSERDSIIVPVETCPECDEDLVTDDFETVCGGCGLVVNDTEVDLGPEWCDYDDGPNHNTKRCNGSFRTVARHDYGLGAVIGYDDHSISNRARQRLQRMRKLDSQATFRSKGERTLAYGFTEINRIISQLSLGFSNRDQAAVLYRQGQAAGSFHGRNLDQMAAGAVYAVVRMEKLGRLPSEIAEIARCNESDTRKGYMMLVRDLQLEIVPPEPVDYVPRIVSLLNVSKPIEERAAHLARQAAEDGSFVGTNPSGIAGACVYVAGQRANDSPTQENVATVADVSEPTIRSGRDALLASDHVHVES